MATLATVFIAQVYHNVLQTFANVVYVDTARIIAGTICELPYILADRLHLRIGRSISFVLKKFNLELIRA